MEPKFIQAGDSVSWTVSDSEYSPDDGWTFAYTLVSRDNQIVIAGADNGAGGFLISVNSAASTAWPVGDYSFFGHATKAPDRYTLRTGLITITPDMVAATAGLDARTQSEIYKDNLIIARNALVSGEWRAVVSSEAVGGRSRSFRTLDEIDVAIRKATRDINLELRRNRASEGLGHTGNVKVQL